MGEIREGHQDDKTIVLQSQERGVPIACVPRMQILFYFSLGEGGGTGAALYLMAPAFSTSTMSKSFFSDFFSICLAKKSAASTEPSA